MHREMHYECTEKDSGLRIPKSINRKAFMITLNLLKTAIVHNLIAATKFQMPSSFKIIYAKL